MTQEQQAAWSLEEHTGESVSISDFSQPGGKSPLTHPVLYSFYAGFFFTETKHKDTYPFIQSLGSIAHKGRSILITGASKGLGRSMAIAFAQSGASRIALGARSSLDSVEADILDAALKAGHPPPQVLKLQLDVVDKESVRKAAQTVAKEFGDDGLDILVNNAGWLESRNPIGEADPDEWWYTFEVNVKGVFLVANAFMSLVLKSREKTIINITSLAAHFIRRNVSANIHTST